MIAKERLEELIEQGATVYVVNNKVVFEEKLNKHYTHDIYNDCIIWWGIPRKRWFFKDCFETKEEAEWHKEFGNIERTERLELPTWEEIKKDFVDNKRDCGSYTIVDRNDISIYIQVYLKGFVHIVLFGDTQYNWELTKENYTLACRKAKELFLGE